MARTIFLFVILFLLISVNDASADKPNFVLIMADDLGWGDTGYNGHPHLKTPHLDAMSQEGIIFERFYSAAPVCSPTRASCLTGRHPYRMGIFGANRGHMKPEEITLAEVLKEHGYTTGHFGKWHLGTLTKDILDGRRGGREKQAAHYAPPWEHGFDRSFSAEVQMPTWDPMKDQKFDSKYWTAAGEFATENLDGDDSRVIADRAVDFIESAAKREQPFLAVVWFHTPHSPVVGGADYRKMYEDHDENHQHYYGCVTAMDEQVGRIRATLKEHGQSDNTLVWFCSDNGPARQGSPRHVGSPGEFRGFKTSLYEGGVRVPGLLVWPNGIKEPTRTHLPCSTSDYFLTCLAAAKIKYEPQRPMDGIDISGVFDGRLSHRPSPIAFEAGKQRALIDNRYKIISRDGGKTWELYNLSSDPGESKDLAEFNPGNVLEDMKAEFQAWHESCANSNRGADY